MSKRKRKRKPLGTIPPRDEAELDMAALVTPQDIDEAKAAARLYGSPLFIALQLADRAEADTNE
jgi:hypothetical protein